MTVHISSSSNTRGWRHRLTQPITWAVSDKFLWRRISFRPVLHTCTTRGRHRATCEIRSLPWMEPGFEGFRARERARPGDSERHKDEFISSSHSLPSPAASAASPPTHSALMFRPSVPAAQSSASSDSADLWPPTPTSRPRDPRAVHSMRDFSCMKKKKEERWTARSVCDGSARIRLWRVCLITCSSVRDVQQSTWGCFPLFSETVQALYRKQSEKVFPSHRARYLAAIQWERCSVSSMDSHVPKTRHGC